MEACWSADSQYVVAGGMDGSIYSWSRSSGELISQADGHPTYPLVCRFNPRKGDDCFCLYQCGKDPKLFKFLGFLVARSVTTRREPIQL